MCVPVSKHTSDSGGIRLLARCPWQDLHTATCTVPSSASEQAWGCKHNSASKWRYVVSPCRGCSGVCSPVVDSSSRFGIAVISCVSTSAARRYIEHTAQTARLQSRSIASRIACAWVTCVSHVGASGTFGGSCMLCMPVRVAISVQTSAAMVSAVRLTLVLRVHRHHQT